MPHLIFTVILPLLLSILYQSVGRFQVFIFCHLIFTVILPLLLNALRIAFVNGIIEVLKSDNEKMLHKFNAFSYDIAMSCLSNMLTGIKACMKGKNVLYITVPNLIIELKESMTLNQLTAYKKKFINYDLVILDELGYITFNKQGGELLFNLLSLRNDTKPIIITTNLSFNR